MTEYQIQANTRRCFSSGRELMPGETYYSVLFHEDGRLARRDYSVECWPGAIAGTFGFWTGRIPPKDASQRPRLDDEMLLECLKRMESEADSSRVGFRYVLALLLMRRKRLKLVETRSEGQEILVLQTIPTRERIEVVNPQLSEDEIQTVQDEVFSVLGW